MNPKNLVLLVCATALTQASFSIPARAQTSPVSDGAQQCQALAGEDFSRLEDAPTQIMATKSVAATKAMRGYCEVSGYVAPRTGFLLRLPLENWNGKFIEHGCGGACGDIDYFSWRCEDPIRRGYACILSDGGHKSTVFDAKWAYNNLQAVMD